MASVAWKYVLTGYKWHPIGDLEGDPSSLTDRELVSLARLWSDQKEELIANGALQEFDQRLRREWSIETGIIENVYTLDRGVTRTLIAKGIDAALIPHSATDRDPTVVARILQDHYEALEGMFDFIGRQRPLSTSYVKEMHAALLRNQETYAAVDQFGHVFEKRLAKGQYKTEPNSPTRPDGTLHEYCPPEHVAAEMDSLIEIHNDQIARGVPTEVAAAWLHHRFTQIHPFADGNGRVARAIASLVFIRANWFPVVVKRDDWVRYIDALEQADRDDLRPLVRLLVEAQRTALIQASKIAYTLEPIATEDDAIAAVRERLVQRGKLNPREWVIAKETAGTLVNVTAQHLNATSLKLHRDITTDKTEFRFPVASGKYASSRVLEIAGLNLDLAAYNANVQLELNTGRADSLNFFFHGIGPRFRGLIGVTVYLHCDAAEPIMLDGGLFQINYQEDAISAEARFRPWLERMIVQGLNEWRKTL